MENPLHSFGNTLFAPPRAKPLPGRTKLPFAVDPAEHAAACIAAAAPAPGTPPPSRRRPADPDASTPQPRRRRVDPDLAGTPEKKEAGSLLRRSRRLAVREEEEPPKAQTVQKVQRPLKAPPATRQTGIPVYEPYPGPSPVEAPPSTPVAVPAFDLEGGLLEVLDEPYPGPSPAEVKPELCMGRTWHGGFGAQCDRLPGEHCGDLCRMHHGSLKHGRVDGIVPEGKLREMRRSMAKANGTAPTPRAQRSSAVVGGRTTSRWLSDGEEEEEDVEDASVSVSSAASTRSRRRVFFAKVALQMASSPSGEEPAEGPQEGVLGIADFAAVSGIGGPTAPPPGAVGEICALVQVPSGGRRVYWRRFLGASELRSAGSGAAIGDHELVETEEVHDLPAEALVPPCGGNPLIQVLSAEEPGMAAGRTFFCRRAIAASGMLWAVPGDAESRQQRREDSLCAFLEAGRTGAHKDAVVPAAMPKAEGDGVASAGALERALAALRPGRLVSSTPTGKEVPPLPGREAEQAEVKSFLRDAICLGGRREVLYVSGMPGTGKTASVLEVVRQLRLEKRREGKLPDFSLAHVNAMTLSHPSAVFDDICRKIPAIRAAQRMKRGRGVGGLGGRAGGGGRQAAATLARWFSGVGASSSKEVTVLVIDEVDCLMAEGQSVLYRLFEWLSKPRARLAVVAIANTMDLPERMLPRVASRLGVLRTNFAPYSRTQLRDILAARLRAVGAEGAFAQDALTLCAARVAAGTGDARKALQVCRSAGEAKLRRGGGSKVTVKDMAETEAELLRANPVAEAVKGLSCKARRLLLAFVLEMWQQPFATALSLRSASRRYETILGLDEKYADEKDADGDYYASHAFAADRHAEDVQFLLQRLEAMAILRVNRKGDNARFGEGMAWPMGSDVRLELGESLDVDELANALRAVQDDELCHELLDNCVRGVAPKLDDEAAAAAAGC